MMEILPASDRSILVRFGDRLNRDHHHAVCALLAAFERDPLEGFTSVSPAYASVLFRYNPLRLAQADAESSVRKLLATSESIPVAGQVVEIPVLYGGDAGPDLEQLADWAGVHPEEVVRRHTAIDYTVYFLGFAPGFAYLGDVDPKIAMPRRSTPRTRVPAGAVGIASRQTGVYPTQTPGGWNLIGRTALQFFFPGTSRKTLLKAGDTVRFRSVGDAAFRELVSGLSAGPGMRKGGADQ